MAQKKISREELNAAFKKLKRFVYYDKTDLVLRQRLAKFESSSKFNESLDTLLEVINDDDLVVNSKFLGWLSRINYRVIPKKFMPMPNTSSEGNSGTFISNRTSAVEYRVGSVNYFFDGPIQLHLIAVLWIMREGRYLDQVLGRECYGARLELSPGVEIDLSSKLYHRYHGFYKKWRDTGIAKARQLLNEDKKDACILGLDIKEYYYHVAIDYDEVALEIARAVSQFEQQKKKKVDGAVSVLLQGVKHISQQYRLVITNALQATHGHVPIENPGLPIGLLSSQLLANWYLRKFDLAVEEELRPIYYGRYVDDIFIVVPAPAELKQDEPIDDLISRLFVRTNILALAEEGDKYRIVARPGLYLQREKCVLQYFDVNHSTAGLDKFQRILEANGSDSLLMPMDEEVALDDVAYDLLYDGSINKFRSVKGVAENRYGLAKYLSRQTMLTLLTEDSPSKIDNSGVIKFFRGRSGVEFYDMWERVLSLLLVSGDASGFRSLVLNLGNEIDKIRCPNDAIQIKIQEDLKKHLGLSVDMVSALKDKSEREGNATLFRKANLLRHHLVRIPLLNYTRYSGSLLDKSASNHSALSDIKIERTPRFVNFDECMLYVMTDRLEERKIAAAQEEKFEQAKSIFERINGCSLRGLSWQRDGKTEGSENEQIQ